MKTNLTGKHKDSCGFVKRMMGFGVIKNCGFLNDIMTFGCNEGGGR